MLILTPNTINDLKRVLQITGRDISVDNLCDELEAHAISRYLNNFRNSEGEIAIVPALLSPSDYEVAEYKNEFRLAYSREPNTDEVLEFKKEHCITVFVLDECTMLNAPYYRIYNPTRKDFAKCPKKNIIFID